MPTEFGGGGSAFTRRRKRPAGALVYLDLGVAPNGVPRKMGTQRPRLHVRVIAYGLKFHAALFRPVLAPYVAYPPK